MKKKFVVPILIITLFLTLACSVALEGISFGDPNERYDPIREMFEQETLEAMKNTEEASSAPAEATPPPEDKPVIPQSSNNANPVTVNAGTNEYSVEATSFNCICQTGGKVTPNFDFQGDHLIAWGDQVYNKIGENTYKREYMGYYILSFPDEPGRADEKIDQLQTSIITFNSNGYVLDSYQGTEMDHCCLNTMTLNK